MDVDCYEGHIGSVEGDGLLEVFCHPKAREKNSRRAGLEIVRELGWLAEEPKRRFGIEMAAQVGAHRGLVYLNTAQDDVSGLAAKLAERGSTLAPPGTVLVSDVAEPLVRNGFELQACPPVVTKGVEWPIAFHLVVGERAEAGDESVPDRTVARARCDGVPLYIDQLVRGAGDKPADGSASGTSACNVARATRRSQRDFS